MRLSLEFEVPRGADAALVVFEFFLELAQRELGGLEFAAQRVRLVLLGEVLLLARRDVGLELVLLGL